MQASYLKNWILPTTGTAYNHCLIIYLIHLPLSDTSQIPQTPQTQRSTFMRPEIIFPTRPLGDQNVAGGRSISKVHYMTLFSARD